MGLFQGVEIPETDKVYHTYVSTAKAKFWYTHDTDFRVRRFTGLETLRHGLALGKTTKGFPPDKCGMCGDTVIVPGDLIVIFSDGIYCSMGPMEFAMRYKSP